MCELMSPRSKDSIKTNNIMVHSHAFMLEKFGPANYGHFHDY